MEAKNTLTVQTQTKSNHIKPLKMFRIHLLPVGLETPINTTVHGASCIADFFGSIIHDISWLNDDSTADIALQHFPGRTHSFVKSHFVKISVANGTG